MLRARIEKDTGSSLLARPSDGSMLLVYVDLERTSAKATIFDTVLSFTRSRFVDGSKDVTGFDDLARSPSRSYFRSMR